MSEEQNVAAEPQNEDENVVTLTLNDVLELEDELMQDTAAVLGASNDKNCSYPDGYVKRQALYSCLTCIPAAKDNFEKAAGICLACSYHCHDGHDLVELYTKREFRCDCGNSKFENMTCNLFSEKSTVNDMNIYNQNFSGLYCTCQRPYPDPEDKVQDEMVQCVICEDWYHTRHLGVNSPVTNFAEMICISCVKCHEFLMYYDHLCVTHVTQTDETKDVDVEENQNGPTAAAAAENAGNEVCKRTGSKSKEPTTKYFKDINWRRELCTCDDCLKMYEDDEITFLLDNEDPVHLYEELSKAKAKQTLEENDKKLLDSLPRVAVMECIAGYNEMKESLGQYLKKFAENKKVVREEDIREFFEGLKANKKAKTENQFLCR